MAPGDPSESRHAAASGGFRRLIGLDRSGPLPDSTRRGQPLRPWTIPNIVGYLRLAAIPVFLALAFDSGDGRSTAAALLYLWITFGDFIDGFLARATGQYSRLGALMDPFIDRLAALSGAAVCWHFDLLPRWALLVLLAREVATVMLARVALRNRPRPRDQLGRAPRDLRGLRRALLDHGLRELGDGGAVLRRPGPRDLRDDAVRDGRPAGSARARRRLSGRPDGAQRAIQWLNLNLTFA